ncbi:hypothetical protein Y1Q_0018675 [Alligator mississippiensis]|uniref:Uncharacterized protein n=1 Tax=Alligator mississippiensis TaxID=8496 RepID=A0A151NRX7_ALLMI|nr:hypothetical protein Y1Q_0018675 [Alligator mississippiensis]
MSKAKQTYMDKMLLIGEEMPTFLNIPLQNTSLLRMHMPMHHAWDMGLMPGDCGQDLRLRTRVHGGPQNLWAPLDLC